MTTTLTTARPLPRLRPVAPPSFALRALVLRRRAELEAASRVVERAERRARALRGVARALALIASDQAHATFRAAQRRYNATGARCGTYL